MTQKGYDLTVVGDTIIALWLFTIIKIRFLLSAISKTAILSRFQMT